MAREDVDALAEERRLRQAARAQRQAWLRRRWAEGATDAQLCAELAAPQRTLSRWLASLGLRRAGTHPSAYLPPTARCPHRGGHAPGHRCRARPYGSLAA